MTEKNKWYKWVIIFLLGYIFFLLNLPKGTKPREIIIEKSDTITVRDTVHTRDTLTITKPIPKYVEIVKTDTVFNDNGDTIQLVTENKLYNDTLCYQNDSIILESSITGINPQLDYIKADWRRQEITNTITVTNYVKKKGLRITPQIGLGYGLLNKKTDVFLGIGLSYNF